MEIKMTDDLIDAAMDEALGSGDTTTALARDLRETTARLASASPYLEPPADLRGRILQATAPTTFRMEDYRKASRDNTWLYKWGFYAAILFLMAAAWFNITMQKQNTALRGAVALADSQMKEIQSTLGTFVNPNVQQIVFEDDKHQAWARAWVDDASGRAVMIMPQELMSKDSAGQLTLTRDDHKVAYKTTMLWAPESMLTSAPRGTTIQMVLNPKTISPEKSNSDLVYRANVAQ